MKLAAAAGIDPTVTPKKSSRLLSPDSIAGLCAILVFIAGWQIASYFAPQYAIPGWPRIIEALFRIDPSDVTITVMRLIGSMVFSFIFGLGLSMWLFDRPIGEAFCMPLIRLVMAVPAVCWVVFSILWFTEVEFRIFFVMCIVCMPVFIVDSLDAMKAVPQDLRQMVESFRPNTIQNFTKIILPGIIPNLQPHACSARRNDRGVGWRAFRHWARFNYCAGNVFGR
jgi:NitT/TauT family transport system permease protein